MTDSHPRSSIDVGAEILRMLPEDGTPVLNRVMRVMLARKLERNVDDDTFFAARDALLARLTKIIRS